jgi:hypothetical protein
MVPEGYELEVSGQDDGGEEAGRGGWAVGTWKFGIGATINCLVIYSRRQLHSLRTFALHLSSQNHKYRNWVAKTNIIELKAPRTFSWASCGCFQWMFFSFIAKTPNGDGSDIHLKLFVTELGIHLLNLGLMVVLKDLPF